MIRRKKRSANFTVTPNHVIEDTRLSYKALGLLVSLLSKPDDWTVHVHQLAAVRHDGITAVRSALRELRECGYARVVPQRDETTGRLIGNSYEISDEYQESAPSDRNTVLQETCSTGNLYYGKPVRLINTDSQLKTDKRQKTEESLLPKQASFTNNNPLPRVLLSDSAPLLSDAPADTAFSLPKRQRREEKFQQQALIVLDHYNTLRQQYIPRARGFSPTADNLQPILRVLKKPGITHGQCTLTLDWWARYKLAEWPDGKQYFVPSTIFGGKFSQYLALAQEWHANGSPAPRGPLTNGTRRQPSGRAVINAEIARLRAEIAVQGEADDD